MLFFFLISLAFGQGFDRGIEIQCGANLTCKFQNLGVHSLVISGSGDMYDLETLEKSQWSGNVSQITSLRFKPMFNFNQNEEAQITSISAGAFSGCTELESVTFPDSLVTIGKNAFAHCTRLKTVRFNENLKTIEEKAFRETIIEQVTIPDSVTTIGDDAFAYCTSLETVELGANVSVTQNLFDGCVKLRKITVSNKNTNIVSLNNVLMSFDKKTILTYPMTLHEHCIEIDQTVENIVARAFMMNDKLQTVAIRGELKVIEEEAFAQCSTLVELRYYGKNQPTIGDKAFDGVNLTFVNVTAEFGGETFSTFPVEKTLEVTTETICCVEDLERMEDFVCVSICQAVNGVKMNETSGKCECLNEQYEYVDDEHCKYICNATEHYVPNAENNGCVCDVNYEEERNHNEKKCVYQCDTRNHELVNENNDGCYCEDKYQYNAEKKCEYVCDATKHQEANVMNNGCKCVANYKNIAAEGIEMNCQFDCQGFGTTNTENNGCNCFEGYEWNGEQQKCIIKCDAANHYVGNKDNTKCVCETNYEEQTINNVTQCVYKCDINKNEILNENNDGCICIEGFKRIDNVCTMYCGAGGYPAFVENRCRCYDGYEYNKTANTCTLKCGENEESYKDVDCVCKEGYERNENGICSNGQASVVPTESTGNLDGSMSVMIAFIALLVVLLF